MNPQTQDCEEGTPNIEGAECLPFGVSQNLTTTAQLFDICTQLELAIEVLIESGEADTAVEALGILEGIVDAIVRGPPGNNPQGEVVAGIFNCLEESWLPIAFPEITPPPSGLQSPLSFSGLQSLSNPFSDIHSEEK